MKITFSQFLQDFHKADDTIEANAKELQSLFIDIEKKLLEKDAKIKKLEKENRKLINNNSFLSARCENLQNGKRATYTLDLSA